MIQTGDIIFCKYRDGGRCRHDIQSVVSVLGGKARTGGGLVVDAATCMEQGGSHEGRTWEVLTTGTWKRYVEVVELLAAERWWERIGELPDMNVAVYRACNMEPGKKPLYYHELSTGERAMLHRESVEHVMRVYRRPLWCGHPFALSGCLGCGRLLCGKILSEDSCRDCGSHVNPHYDCTFKRLRLLAGLEVPDVNRLLRTSDYESIEEGRRRPTSAEVEKLIGLYRVEGMNFGDVLDMLHEPDSERNMELDAEYRKQVGSKVKSKKK